jgi:hypothetical protein
MLYEEGKSMQYDMYERLKSRSHTTTTTMC